VTTDRKLDLGPLDPSRDPVRWERLVRSVAARGAEGAARRRPGALALQLAAWARPALAFAAAVALAVWIPAWLRPAPGAPAAATPATPAATDGAARLAAWAASDEPGRASALLLTLGDDDDAR
jgi:hypothetical protein